MSASNYVATGSARCEIEIKKSRFIAYAYAAKTREQALEILATVRTRYPDARHHCWAYALGGIDSPMSAAMNDDGEPSGTAGKPILNVLQHKGISNVMVVVVRYFGGVRLGAGGLVRAYSQAAEAVMQKLPNEIHVVSSRWQLNFDFALEQPLRHFLSAHEGEILAIDYSSQVTASLALPEKHSQALLGFARNTS